MFEIDFNPEEFSMRLNSGDVELKVEYYRDRPNRGVITFSIFRYLTRSPRFVVASFQSEQHFKLFCPVFDTFDEFELFVSEAIKKYRNKFDPTFLTVDEGK